MKSREGIPEGGIHSKRVSDIEVTLEYHVKILNRFAVLGNPE
jgi:hypothetical protein